MVQGWHDCYNCMWRSCLILCFLSQFNNFMRMTFTSIVHPFPSSMGYNDQLPVGLISQLIEHCTEITRVVVQISFRSEFFRSIFHYWLSTNKYSNCDYYPIDQHDQALYGSIINDCLNTFHNLPRKISRNRRTDKWSHWLPMNLQ